MNMIDDARRSAITGWAIPYPVAAGDFIWMGRGAAMFGASANACQVSHLQNWNDILSATRKMIGIDQERSSELETLAAFRMLTACGHRVVFTRQT